ncbi:MAG: peptidase M14 [Acidithiobacillales bacterium SG8_45]|jgi:succinylglutamate desuccinylase|nr:MAG: peptidase M14 [Acidithiobacillales bacterium SG8_45]
MLNVIESLPEGILELEAHELHQVLAGPTLIHLPGRRQEPLFVSVLLHGNEDTGWQAMRALLRKLQGQELPRALSLFIGNIAAAKVRQRFLEGQPDYNRVWEDVPGNEALPERRMMQQIVDDLRARKVFASVDVHNNTGLNPHYACVRVLEEHHLHLATLFSRTVVYFRTPAGVQTAPFAEICPSVTIEAGQAGQTHGFEHTLAFIDACLHLSHLPDHPVPAHDIDLYHTVAICKVPPEASFGFGGDRCDLNFVEDLDHLNFRELPVGTTLARIPGDELMLVVRDESGEEVTARYFELADGELRTTLPFMPSMLAMDETAIRQDCLCYLMERHPGL